MFFTKIEENHETLVSLRAEGMSTADIFRAFQIVEGNLAWEERWVTAETTPHETRMEHLYWEMIRTL